MTVAYMPTATGMPNNGFEGTRFLDYPVFEGLLLQDLYSADRPAGTGPFHLSGFVPRTSAELTKNDSCWDRAPIPTSVACCCCRCRKRQRASPHFAPSGRLQHHHGQLPAWLAPVHPEGRRDALP